jgi:glycosidase
LNLLDVCSDGFSIEVCQKIFRTKKNKKKKQIIRRGMNDKLSDDPLWFKDAIFYEVYVRGFYDSNADGLGDFRGLTEKLDHIQWLGVDCILLPPIHASPLRDGGYDVSNYYAILPEYGTPEDFKHFLDAAHAHGIRVIADLMLNHTSDQHPWFQESRGAPDALKRDWYVWPPPHRAFDWAAPEPSRQPDPLLWRRDRHGR